MRPITTTRLVIREFEDADADAVVRLLDDCFGPAQRPGREAWLEWTVRNYRALEQLRQPPYGDYAVTLRDGGGVIGSVGLVPSFGPFETLPSFASRLRDRATGRFTTEMGLFWAVSTPHRGTGFATEAAAAIAAFAFETLNVERLVATTEDDNHASIGVMRRLGMAVQRNPKPEPIWFQTAGILFNPGGPES